MFLIKWFVSFILVSFDNKVHLFNKKTKYKDTWFYRMNKKKEMKSFLFFTFFVESELVNKGMKGVNLEFKYFF